MKYIKTNWNIPYYNMAFEYYILNNPQFNDNYVFFYIHSPSVIIGKNQNTAQEINEKYIRENNICVARRNTGGGSVYHDEGNLNFSFIFQKEDNNGIDFKKYTLPVINALNELGVDCTLSGRNDILLDGKKISGNAQCQNKEKVLHHGTLMYDVNIENMVNALNVSELKIQSKAIKSVKSRVCNIKDYMKTDMDIFEFKDFLLNSFYKNTPIEEYILTKEDIDEVEKSVKNKFSTWEYNYGLSPKYKINKKKKFDCGLIYADYNIENGYITDIKIYGDYFSLKETYELENMLKNKKINYNCLLEFVKTINITDYINSITNEEFVSLLCE